METVSKRGLVRTPGAAGRALGLLEVSSERRTRLIPVICARRQFSVSYPPRASDGAVLVLRSPEIEELPVLGLKVDDVITVLECAEEALHPVPPGLPQHSPWVEQLVDVDAQRVGGPAARVLVQVLSPARILADVLAPGSAAWPATARVIEA